MNNKSSNEFMEFPNSREEWEVLGKCGINLLQIAKLEIQTAMARFPELVLLYLIRMPAIILMWISFSLLPAWAAYQLTASVFVGLLVLFLLQATLVILIDRTTRRKLKESSLPVTREFSARLGSLVFVDSGRANTGAVKTDVKVNNGRAN